jgi:hypothetical protein
MAKKALILAIERDSDQARLLSEVIHRRLRADLVLAETAEKAMTSLGKRVPNLVLIPALLSPREETTLRDGLRASGAAANIEMLTIPVLAPTVAEAKSRGMLSRFRRGKSSDVSEAGFSSAAFVEQVAAYLQRGAGASTAAGNAPQGQEQEEEVHPLASKLEPADQVDLSSGPRDRPAEPAAAVATAGPVSADAVYEPLAEDTRLREEPEPERAPMPQAEPSAPPAALVDADTPEPAAVAASAAPFDIVLSDENADWATVMESLQADLDRSNDSSDAPAAQEAPQTARPGHEAWAHLNPLHAGFPTLLAKLHELMEEPERMVA